MSMVTHPNWRNIGRGYKKSAVARDVTVFDLVFDFSAIKAFDCSLFPLVGLSTFYLQFIFLVFFLLLFYVQYVKVPQMYLIGCVSYVIRKFEPLLGNVSSVLKIKSKIVYRSLLNRNSAICRSVRFCKWFFFSGGTALLLITSFGAMVLKSSCV